MSANNWAVCPKCHKDEQDRIRQTEEKLNTLYGKVSIEEYRKLQDELKKVKKLDTTLREDWKLGIHNGKFFVDYSASCKVCGFKYDFAYKDVNPTEKNK